MTIYQDFESGNREDSGDEQPNSVQVARREHVAFSSRRGACMARLAIRLDSQQV